MTMMMRMGSCGGINGDASVLVTAIKMASIMYGMNNISCPEMSKWYIIVTLLDCFRGAIQFFKHLIYEGKCISMSIHLFTCA